MKKKKNETERSGIPTFALYMFGLPNFEENHAYDDTIGQYVAIQIARKITTPICHAQVALPRLLGGPW